MTSYICLVPNISGLTMGACYTEFLTVPNVFNACVINDEGNAQFVDRKYLKEIDNNDGRLLNSNTTKG